MLPIQIRLNEFVSKTAIKPVKRSSTNYIVIHHAAATYKRGMALKSIYNYHSGKWPAYGRIGYHLVCQEEIDGTISINLVNALDTVGAGVYNRNGECIHICAATDFKDNVPAAKWFEALVSACMFVKRSYNVPIVGHKEITVPGYGTECPGSVWSIWKEPFIKTVNYYMVSSQVIGVPPSCTFEQFRAFAERHKAPVSVLELDRVFRFALWLDIDPAFVLAVWHHEQGSPLGSSQVGIATCNPFNIKAYGRCDKVTVKGADWNRYESWQIGLYYSVLHLKEFYGKHGLLTIDAIVNKFAPEDDNNDPESYAAKVKKTMATIAAL